MLTALAGRGGAALQQHTEHLGDGRQEAAAAAARKEVKVTLSGCRRPPPRGLAG